MALICSSETLEESGVSQRRLQPSRVDFTRMMVKQGWVRNLKGILEEIIKLKAILEKNGEPQKKPPREVA